jgi:hypothetical protein
MSKPVDSKPSMPYSKSWADIDNDDFFAQVAQDKPASSKASPTASWTPRGVDRTEKRSATTGGVPWSFPNPVQPQGRFDGLSPNTRRSATMGDWRK